MTPFWEDDHLTLYGGDCREVLRELPDESVHCVVTSPPYWGLRDYGTASWDGGDPECDHKALAPTTPTGTGDGPRDAARSGQPRPTRRRASAASASRRCGARRIDSQLGLEATPEEFVANMVDVFREVRRVLRKDGTLWLNLGDSYAARIRRGDDADRGRRRRATAPRRSTTMKRRNGHGLKPKDLVGIPWRVAFALQADGWYLRSDIIWAKPNPMPESVTDRPTKAHEYLFLLTRSPRYYYDAEAVREPLSERPTRRSRTRMVPRRSRITRRSTARTTFTSGPGIGTCRAPVNPAGRNLRSVWNIATEPYPGAHFATFPRKLVEPCVKAGTSERGVCPECGAPWVRELNVELSREAASPCCSLARSIETNRGQASGGRSRWSGKRT